MASLSRVPCLELSTENINQHWPQLQSSLNDSHFVAIDLVSSILHMTCQELLNNNFY